MPFEKNAAEIQSRGVLLLIKKFGYFFAGSAAAVSPARPARLGLGELGILLLEPLHAAGVSTNFCLPVQNGWHTPQISTSMFRFIGLPVSNVLPQATLLPAEEMLLPDATPFYMTNLKIETGQSLRGNGALLRTPADVGRNRGEFCQRAFHSNAQFEPGTQGFQILALTNLELRCRISSSILARHRRNSQHGACPHVSPPILRVFPCPTTMIRVWRQNLSTQAILTIAVA